jgi:hypothetical protein
MLGPDAKFLVLWSLVIVAALIFVRPSRRVTMGVLSLAAIALLIWGLVVFINR